MSTRCESPGSIFDCDWQLARTVGERKHGSKLWATVQRGCGKGKEGVQKGLRFQLRCDTATAANFSNVPAPPSLLSPAEPEKNHHKWFRIASWRRNKLARHDPLVPFVSLRHRRIFPFVVILYNTGLSSCEYLLESTLIKSSQLRDSLLYPGRLPLHPEPTCNSHRAIKRQVPPVRDIIFLPETL